MRFNLLPKSFDEKVIEVLKQCEETHTGMMTAQYGESKTAYAQGKFNLHWVELGNDKRSRVGRTKPGTWIDNLETEETILEACAWADQSDLGFVDFLAANV